MRLFTAILLPDGLCKRLADLARYLRDNWNEELLGPSDRHCPPAKWVPAENLHVTLKFFGEVADADVKPLCDVLESVRGSGQLHLVPDRLECFPPRGPVRIMTVGLGGDVAQAERLFDQIERAAAPLGYPLDRRRFRPHITLARLRDPLPRCAGRSLATAAGNYLPTAPFHATQFALVQSILGGEEARYIPIARFDLGE